MQTTTYEGKTVNPNEAPKGYVAISKSQIPEKIGDRKDENICHFCDWRPQCQDKNTDFEIPSNRCMSFPITSFKTGNKIYRSDGCSVIFKKKY